MTTSWPSACAASTRQAQTSVPSSSTEQEPHSPCSQAFFEPGRPRRSRSAKSRLSPSQTSVSSLLAVDAERDPHAQAPLQRALGKHAQRVAAVGGGAAHVVDRARRLGHLLGEGRRVPRRGAVTRPGTGPAEPNAARSSSPSTTSASEKTAITIALRGPTFMNVCLGPGAGIRTATISSSGSSAFRFGPTRNSRSGTVREPRRRGELDLRAVDEQRRQRVPGGGSGAEVAADRAAVADLRPADRARGLGQREQRLGEPHRLRVGEPGSRAAASRSRATSPAARPPRSGSAAPAAARGRS